MPPMSPGSAAFNMWPALGWVQVIFFVGIFDGIFFAGKSLDMAERMSSFEQAEGMELLVVNGDENQVFHGKHLVEHGR
jgi:hypothetical protein